MEQLKKMVLTLTLDTDNTKSNEFNDGKLDPSNYSSMANTINDNALELVFDGISSNFCVCMIDIVDSTVITSSLPREDQIRKFYSIFVNSVSHIISHFGGRILKTGGDSVIYYFQNTAELKNIEAFKNVLECGVSLLDLRNIINSFYEEECIQPISYRISADYGRLELAESRFSMDRDLFGPTMNLCAKINNKANPNSMVIGGDLHQVLKKLYTFDEYYKFEEISALSVGLKQFYPIFHIISNASIKADRIKYEKLKAMLFHQNLLRGRRYESDKLECAKTKQGVQQPGIPQAIDKFVTSYASSYIPTAATQESPQNILVIDDEPDCLFTYQSFLEKERFAIHCFSDPKLALKRFARESNFDLVILDIRMPHPNGLQLYQRLKSINSRMKVLFITALDATAELMTLLPEVRMAEVMRKPVTRDKFIENVKYLLDQHQRIRTQTT